MGSGGCCRKTPKECKMHYSEGNPRWWCDDCDKQIKRTQADNKASLQLTKLRNKRAAQAGAGAEARISRRGTTRNAETVKKAGWQKLRRMNSPRPGKRDGRMLIESPW